MNIPLLFRCNTSLNGPLMVLCAFKMFRHYLIRKGCLFMDKLTKATAWSIDLNHNLKHLYPTDRAIMKLIYHSVQTFDTQR